MNFNVLNEDKDDTSTNNLQRKLNKKIRHLKEKQLKHPDDIINEKIHELEEKLKYLNPVKTNSKKNKKEKISSDKLLEQEYQKNSAFWIKCNEKCKREERDKENIRKNNIKMIHKKRRTTVKLSTNKYKEIIHMYTTDQLIEELNVSRIKLYIKNNIMTLNMSLNNYKIDIPYDIILHIIHFTRNHIIEIPSIIIEIPSIFKLIPKDIYSYNKKKYRDNQIEHQLELKYHPDNTNDKTIHTMIFIRDIMDLKEKYINYY